MSAAVGAAYARAESAREELAKTHRELVDAVAAAEQMAAQVLRSAGLDPAANVIDAATGNVFPKEKRS